MKDNLFSQAATAGPPWQEVTSRIEFPMNNPGYRHGSRISPNNELLLAGKRSVQIRIGSNRTALSRVHGKLALDGWMPIIVVNADDGLVRYEVTSGQSRTQI